MECKAIEFMRTFHMDKIAHSEYQEWGHRIIYDPITGWSLNVCGLRTTPANVDPISRLRVR